MSTQEEKKLDDFIRQMVIDSGMEKPGPELKRNIMFELERKYSRLEYRSLIPKKGWIWLGISLFIFIVFVVLNPFGVQALGIDLFPWDLSRWFGQSSLVTVCAILVLGLMMCGQVYLLKRKMDQN